ncbi:hypothetical protein NDU88_003276 [Pleurodeles waltl]|uniref:Uncharacterized protein n=1 Tax=Pleurodeles waltl TaxID=8319 RepID=A0AAV7VGZ8_PLEWA|nr:hypothetical protein NDU88_003276 [Pleurodeles waltl]
MEPYGTAMRDEEMQAVQNLDVNRNMAERKKGDIYVAHSLGREEGPALVLEAAFMECSEDEDEQHCRPPKKVYPRGSGVKEAVGKSTKAGGAMPRVSNSGRLYEDESKGRVLAGTSQSSRELQAAQDTRGEEKAEPRVASWTDEGPDWSIGFSDNEVVKVPWDGSGHSALDYDEESLEEGEVQEEYEANKKEAERWQKEKSQKVRVGAGSDDPVVCVLQGSSSVSQNIWRDAGKKEDLARRKCHERPPRASSCEDAEIDDKADFFNEILDGNFDVTESCFCQWVYDTPETLVSRQ